MMQAITDMNIQYEDKERWLFISRPDWRHSQRGITSPDLVSSVTRHLKGAPVYVVHRLDQPVEWASCAGKDKAGGSRAE